MQPLFKNEMSTYQSKANLGGKILFIKFTHHLDPEIRKMPVRELYGNREFYVPCWSMIYLTFKFRFNAIITVRNEL